MLDLFSRLLEKEERIVIHPRKNSKLLLGLLVFFLAVPISVYGEEHNVRTNGNVHFTGKWEGPIVDPSPPTGEKDRPNLPSIVKPEGRLPQMNGLEERYYTWFGWLLVIIVTSYSRYRWQKNKKENQRSIIL